MIISLLSILACGEKASPLPADTAEPPSETEPSNEPSEETGTDEDGDSFTVEDGDCDDSDPWVNPALDEEQGDGKDNDCDGLIDD